MRPIHCVLWDDHVVTGHSDGSVQFRQNGTPVVFKVSGKYITSVSSVEGYVAATSIDGTLKVFGTKLSTRLPTSLYASAWVDQNFLLTGSSTGEICMWNVHNFPQNVSLKIGHTHAITSIATGPSKVASSDQTCIKVYGADSGHFHRTIQCKGVTTCLSWSTRKTLLAAGGYDRNLSIYDIRLKTPLTHTLSGHSDCVLSVDFSSDGYHIATGGADGTVRIWDIRTQKDTHTVDIPHPRSDIRNFVNGVAFSPSGKDFVYVTSQEQILYGSV